MYELKRALFLLSGGLDSAVALHMGIAEMGFNSCYLVSFNYGQKAVCELRFAKMLAKDLGPAIVREHYVLEIQEKTWIEVAVRSGSSLLEGTGDVPRHESREDVPSGHPTTYFPARNVVFLSYATSLAEMLDIRDVVVGFEKPDDQPATSVSGLPDRAPDTCFSFLKAMELAATLGTTFSDRNEALRFHAPLFAIPHWAAVSRAYEMGLDPTHTMSCYSPVRLGEPGFPIDEEDPRKSFIHCGTCRRCVTRKQLFYRAGRVDPTRYFRS